MPGYSKCKSCNSYRFELPIKRRNNELCRICADANERLDEIKTSAELLRLKIDEAGSTGLSAFEFLDAVADYVETNGSTEGLSFSRVNLSCLELSHENIAAWRNRRASDPDRDHRNNSVDYDHDYVSKSPNVIASAPDFDIRKINQKRLALQDIDFSGASLVAADLSGSDLSRCNFRNTELRYANLEYTRLWRADFTGASLQVTNLRGASLQNADFSSTNLFGSLLSGTFLYHTKFENTEISYDELKVKFSEEKPPLKKENEKETAADRRGRYREVHVIYDRLRRNFISIGNRRDASWAFIQSQKALRKSRSKWALSSVWNLTQDWLFRYGEKPLTMILWSLTIIILFAATFGIAGGIENNLNDVSSEVTWYDLIVISMRSFVTMDNAVTGNDVYVVGSGVEAGLGVVFIALLLYSLGRRMEGY